MHWLAASLFRDYHLWVFLACMGLFGLIQLSSWLATRRGGRSIPWRVMLLAPVTLYLYSLHLLLPNARRPRQYDDGEGRAAAEDVKVLRRDLDNVTADLHEANAALKTVLHTGALLGLIALCRGTPSSAGGKDGAQCGGVTKD